MTASARVVVARLDNAGDVLLSGPAVRAIARHAEVTMLVGARGAEAAHLLPGVDAVIGYDAPWVGFRPPAVDPAATARLVADLASRAFDAAVIFTSFHQSPLPLALLFRLAGIRRVAATCVDYPGSLLDVRRAPDPERHEVDEALALAAAAGFPPAPGDDARLALRDAVGPPPFAQPYVVVHPGASVTARAVRPDLASGAARALLDAGWVVAVTGSDGERGLCAAVTPDDARAVDMSGPGSLRALADVLAGASVVVCGNTGPAHLAAAVGTPVASVFAPVVPWAKWRPWGVPTEALGRQDVGCSGCRARCCPIPGQPCIGSIEPHDVVAAVERLARAAARPVPPARVPARLGRP